MKRILWLACFVLVLVGAAIAYRICPPSSTRPFPIPEKFVVWLRSEHPEEVAARLSDPLEVSLRLLYFGAGDPINTQGMTIRVLSGENGECTVSIDDHHVEDDSISRTYDLITLKREGMIWIPTEHRIAQQGRGVFGWTTGSTN